MSERRERKMIADNEIDDVACYIYVCEDPECDRSHIVVNLNSDLGLFHINIPPNVAMKMFTVMAQSLCEAGLIQGQLVQGKDIDDLFAKSKMVRNSTKDTVN